MRSEAREVMKRAMLGERNARRIIMISRAGIVPAIPGAERTDIARWTTGTVRRQSGQLVGQSAGQAGGQAQSSQEDHQQPYLVHC